MIDLSKLPWGELKLPGEVTASAKRHPDGNSYAIFSGNRAVAWKDDRDDHGWITASGPADTTQKALDATKLVDAFIEEHSKPKLPDVVPPDNCAWYNHGEEWVLTDARRRPEFHSVFIPKNGPERDAMLACCEAAAPKATKTARIAENGGFSIDIPTDLVPGRYAVSFRRLP